MPDPAHLASDGHHLLLTRFGPLDVLGQIGRGRDFDALLPRTEPISISPGVSVPVLTLEAIIEIKVESGRPKDLAVLPTLRRTLEEKRRP